MASRYFRIQRHHSLQQLCPLPMFRCLQLAPVIQRDGNAPPEGAQELPALIDRHPQQPVLQMCLALKFLVVLKELPA